jgi:hypothetical protein
MGRLDSETESRPWVSAIGKQLSNQLTELIDPGSMRGRLPPNMTPGMLEMNLGLQWGMNEFRYGSHKAELAKKLAAADASKVRQAIRKHLAAGQCTMVTIGPAGPEK